MRSIASILGLDQPSEYAIRKVVDEKSLIPVGWLHLADVLEKLGRTEEAQEARGKGSQISES
ncbi:MAG: hypothetical protein ACTSSE_05135 [Candidatus Thorarchaeota archaeon]